MRREDLLCKDNCGKGEIDERIISTLIALENLLGKIKITSGYRCEEYNRKIGGAKNSAHLHGLAVDVRVRSSLDRFKVIQYLLCSTPAVRRIGIYKTFIHFDFGDKDTGHPTPRIWVNL